MEWEYRVRLKLANEDPMPSPESVEHLIRHGMRDDGIVDCTVLACVPMEVRNDDDGILGGDTDLPGDAPVPAVEAG